MIFQTDALIKTLLEESLNDLKKNSWLIDYILWDFTHSPFLRGPYGQKQVDAAKEFFKNNNINIFHQFVKDKEKFPCIILTLGTSTETQEYRTMGDVGSETVTLMPSLTGQKIPYVVQPFTPAGFEPSTGTVEVPEGIDISAVSAGMVLLDPTSGDGTPVLSINGQNIIIQAGLELDSTQLGVVPQYRYFQTRMGRSFFQETWNITCATNDPQSLLWLHSVVVFTMLRYREFMEHNGILEVTNFSSTDMFTPEFSNAGGEEIYCRQVTVTNKVLQTWPRDLHRKIESVLLRDSNPGAVTLSDPEGYTGGIKIVSNLTTPPLQQNDSNWFTVSPEDENE